VSENALLQRSLASVPSALAGPAHVPRRRRHHRHDSVHSFDFTDFSVAAEELDEVASVTSAGGDANDLAHNGVYTVEFAFIPAASNYTGPTTIRLEEVARTDLLWLFGIGASICGSFGVGAPPARSTPR
jgi:hypothetical protein